MAQRILLSWHSRTRHTFEVSPPRNLQVTKSILCGVSSGYSVDDIYDARNTSGTFYCFPPPTAFFSTSEGLSLDCANPIAPSSFYLAHCRAIWYCHPI